MFVTQELYDSAGKYLYNYYSMQCSVKDVSDTWGEWLDVDLGTSMHYLKHKHHVDDHETPLYKWLCQPGSFQRKVFDSICEEVSTERGYRPIPYSWSTEALIPDTINSRYRLRAVVAEALTYLRPNQAFKNVKPTPRTVSAANRIFTEIEENHRDTFFSNIEFSEFLLRLANNEACIVVEQDDPVSAENRKGLALNIFYHLSCFFDYKCGTRIKTSLIQKFFEVIDVDIDERQLRRWMPKTLIPRAEDDVFKFRDPVMSEEEFRRSLESQTKILEKGYCTEEDFGRVLRIYEAIKAGQYRTEIPPECPDELLR